MAGRAKTKRAYKLLAPSSAPSSSSSSSSLLDSKVLPNVRFRPFLEFSHDSIYAHHPRVPIHCPSWCPFHFLFSHPSIPPYRHPGYTHSSCWGTHHFFIYRYWGIVGLVGRYRVNHLQFLSGLALSLCSFSIVPLIINITVLQLRYCLLIVTSYLCNSPHLIQ